MNSMRFLLYGIPCEGLWQELENAIQARKLAFNVDHLQLLSVMPEHVQREYHCGNIF